MIETPVAPQARPRVLILEDEGLVAEDVRVTLGKLGFDVVHVTDRGDDAVVQAGTHRPDLVLCDIQVRGPIDGIVAAQRIRKAYQIPVVFATAFADPEVLRRAGEAEPYGYVIKPYSEDDLRVTLSVALFRKAAEDRSGALERWLSSALGSIGDAVIAIDRDGRVTYVNAVAELLSGWSRDDALGKRVADVFDVSKDDVPLDLLGIIATVESTGTVFHLAGDVFLRTKGGGRVPIDDSISPIRRDDGSVDGVVILFRDRTAEVRFDEERLTAQRRMEEAQRLESLGVLAGGIAHDLNNLLTVVTAHVGLARASEGATPDETEASLTHIEAAAERAGQLCGAMLAYAGRGRQLRQAVDLSTFVQQTVDLLKITTRANVKLSLELADDLPLVYMDPSQIQQVLMNLVINATDAIGDTPGSVTVRTAVADIEPAALQGSGFELDHSPGRYVELAVVDNGPGIPVELHSRIFEPFFSTKSHGRGLGLAAVRGIVKQHGAVLLLDSAEGRGTTVRVLLPPGAGALGTSSPAERIRVYAGRGHVLIVDDDPAILQAASLALRRFGLTSETAPNGREALALLRARPYDFDLLMTDLTMPEMTGAQLTRVLADERPELPVVLTSGWSAERASDLLALPNARAFVPKPFTVAELGAAVLGVLHAQDAAKR